MLNVHSISEANEFQVPLELSAFLRSRSLLDEKTISAVYGTIYNRQFRRHERLLSSTDLVG